MTKATLKTKYKDREVELKDLCNSYNCAQAILSLNEKLLEAYRQDGNGDAPETKEFIRCIEDKKRDIEWAKRRLHEFTGESFTEYHIFAYKNEVRVYDYWSKHHHLEDYRDKPKEWVQLELF